MVNLVLRHIYSPLPQGETPVRIKLEDSWVTEPVCTFQRREKSRTATGIRVSYRSAPSPVPTSTTFFHNSAVSVLV